MNKVDRPQRGSTGAAAEPLREALLRTASSVLALQRRAEDELHDAKHALEMRTRELESSLALLRTTLEASPDGIVVIDLDGRVRMTNRRFVTIWGADEALVARGVAAAGLLACVRDKLVDPDKLVRCAEALQHSPPSPSHDVFELKDGRTFERHAAPRLVDGRCEGAMVVWRDVTENRRALAAMQAQQVAERANRAKSDFVARMSHELRTPLHAILGFAEVLQQAGAPALAATQRGHVGRIHTAGMHLLGLIDDLLDISRLEGGTLDLRVGTVDAAAELRACLATLDVQAAARGIVVRVDAVPGEAVLVLADDMRLRQVLLNLVSNAIKYNRPGGSVSVRLVVETGECTISIADTGLGLSAGQLARLFEPFNRLGRDALGIEGTGIGLVIAKSLVEMMGGTLVACSRPGEGSEFTVRLRRADGTAGCAAAMMAAPIGAPACHAAGTLRGSVVYIDDDEVNRVLMQAMLALHPAVGLDLAADGAGGLAAVAAAAPDLVLIDMMLPDISGLEVLRALRADPALTGLPCVAVSANAMPEQIAEALGAGFDGYLTKPLAAQALLAQLDRWLGPSRRHA